MIINSIDKQIHKYLFLIFSIFFIGCGGDGYVDITRLSNSIDGMYANDIKIENNLIDLSNQDNFTMRFFIFTNTIPILFDYLYFSYLCVY
jgi:hypothetical protein